MNYKAILGADKLSKENFAKSVRRLYTSNAEEVLKLYNPATEEEVEQVATDLASDRFIGFSTWKWADVHSKTGQKPVYRYLYKRARPAMTPEMGDAQPGLAGGVQKGTTANKAPAAKGAVHSAEIEYAMGNLASNKVYAWTEDDYKVSRIMQEYFANFIKKADPNGAGLPEWPTANTSPVKVMLIDVNTVAETEKNVERYHFIDKLTNKTAGK